MTYEISSLDLRFYKAATLLDSNGIKKALSEGANINARNRDGWTALMTLINATFSPDGEQEDVKVIAKELIDLGCDVNIASPNGTTAIHVAASRWQTEIIRHLIMAGADPNAKDNLGHTPAFLLARAGAGIIATTGQWADALVELISHGGDIENTICNGTTILAIAKENGWHEVVAAQAAQEAESLKKKAGALNRLDEDSIGL